MPSPPATRRRVTTALLALAGLAVGTATVAVVSDTTGPSPRETVALAAEEAATGGTTAVDDTTSDGTTWVGRAVPERRGDHHHRRSLEAASPAPESDAGATPARGPVAALQPHLTPRQVADAPPGADPTLDVTAASAPDPSEGASDAAATSSEVARGTATTASSESGSPSGGSPEGATAGGQAAGAGSSSGGASSGGGSSGGGAADGGSSGGSSASPAPDPAPAVRAAPDAVQRTHELIAATRRSAGVPALSRSGGADGVAQAWAERMAADGNQRHNPNFADQLWAIFGPVPVAENVGHTSSGDAASMHRAFEASAGHRANLLGDFQHVGVGAALDGQGRLWVVHTFAGSS